MAVFILAPDPDGNCCECSARLLPCDSCEEPPPSCVCHLKIPISSSDTYADYTEAQTAINDYTFGCFAYNLVETFAPTYPIISFSAANPSSTELSISTSNSRIERGTTPSPFYGANVGGVVGFTIDDVTSIDVTLDFTDNATLGVNSAYFLLQMLCPTSSSDTEIQSNISSPATHTFSSLAAGQYVFTFTYGGNNTFTPGGNVSATLTLTSSADFVVNPIFAYWDDGGTTRLLPACPKTYMPTTNPGSTWYASEAAAQTAINQYTSNCVARFFTAGGNDAVITFTANGTSSVDVTTDMVPDGSVFDIGQYSVVFGATLETGATISINYSLDYLNTSFIRPGAITVAVLDIEGNLLALTDTDSFTFLGGTNNLTGTVTTGAIPYSGAFQIQVTLSRNPGISNIVYLDSASFDFTASSSSSMTVNGIQALYNTGLDCPARLDC